MVLGVLKQLPLGLKIFQRSLPSLQFLNYNRTIVASTAPVLQKNYSTLTLGQKTPEKCLLKQIESCFSPTSIVVQERGMKIMGRVRRRCKDCYLIWQNGLVHNRCKTHGRHKQMQKGPYIENMRIITHATQSPRRLW